MAIVKRLLKCDDCGFQFVVHAEKDDPYGDCPECRANALAADLQREREEGEARIAKMIGEGKAPGKRGNRIKALKVAEEMMQEMGHSDFSDTGKAGDRAAKGVKPMQTAEAEAMAREVKNALGASDAETQAVHEANQRLFQNGGQGFWQNTATQTAAAPLLAAAPQFAAEARAHGVDPIALLHQDGKTGKLGRPEVVAAVRA